MTCDRYGVPRATLCPDQLGWLSNRYLVLAVLCEAAMLAGFLYFPPLAAILGQAPPSETSYPVALLALPAVLGADAMYKHYRRTKKRSGRPLVAC